jgi:hypothetical protein
MKHELLDRLRRTGKPIVLSGAGAVGKAVLRELERQEIAVAAVCDGSAKVAGTDFHGVGVIHTPRLRAYFDDALVVISVIPIADVVDVLHMQGFTDWVAAGPLLEGMDTAQDAPEIDGAKYSIESCIICHRAFLAPNKVFLSNVDLIITERCSLKCRDCANLMQYYERPRNVPLDTIFRAIDALCALADEIMEMRVIGGDAFMNKDWPRVVEKLIGEPKIRRILMYTNGGIVPGTETAALLKHPKVILIVTDYGPLSRNLNRLRAFFNEHAIAYRIFRVDNWTDCASLQKHDRTPEENARVYRECCAKSTLSLSDGRLFRCPFAANADRLAAVPEFPDDFIDILAGDGSPDDLARRRRRLFDYVQNKEVLGVCDYCNGRPLSGNEIVPAVQTDKPLAYRHYPRPALPDSMQPT